MTERKTRKLAFHKLIPSMITLTAMAAGMTAIRCGISGKWDLAVIGIVAAAFLDAFDGAAARLLKAQSKLGAELDSLSDVVNFGVAPALVIFLWSTQNAGRFGWITALIFMMGVALRLARFNVSKAEEMPDDPLSKYFTGMPSPAGGGLALLPIVISLQLDGKADSQLLHTISNPYAIGFWLIFLAGMMVSHVPTFSSKQIRIPQRLSVLALALFGLIIAGLFNEPWPTLTFMGAAYLVSIPWSIRHYAKKKKSLAQGINDPDDIEHDE
jgi:CDP-diacylglycerol--serine O-phosphatidyltransferase